MEQYLDFFKKPLKNYIFILFIIVVGFTLYINTFQNKMFWDDDDGILKNQFVQDWQYFPKYFSENLIAGRGLSSDYWRPALLSVFSLEWHLWGTWTPGYHFINTSIHIADAILLFLILLYLFKNRPLAILTALIFLVHPLQTEAVAYVSGLGDSLSVFFMFSSILFYLHFRMSEKSQFLSTPYFISLFMFIFSFMSKETAIILPALIFISDFVFLDQGEKLSLREKLKKITKAVWPFFVLAGVYILLRATVLNFVNTFNLYNEENAFTTNFHIRLFTFFRILTAYFGLLFWPFDLHMERSIHLANSFASFSVILGGLIFLSLLVLALMKFKRFPILGFGILWFLIGLSPTSNLLIPINGLIYEHWLYLPLIGIFLVLIWLGMILGERYNIEKILALILIAFLVFLSVLTINRNKDWYDPITFYNQTLKYAPSSYRVVNNLGMAYDDQGSYEKAEETYKRAISLVPTNPVAFHNLGNSYKEEGRTDLAVENFEKAISLDPGFFFSYNALVNIYAEKKDYEKVLYYLGKISEADPENQAIETLIERVKEMIELKK